MKINHLIDHTLLKPDSTILEIIKIIDEAKRYNFYSVCINPYFVALAKENLVDSQVKICTVIGFPLGANTTKTKTLEAVEAIENGVNELDMVINIGALKDKNYNYVLNDIASVVKVAKEKQIVKVIIETFLLTEEEKITACKIAKEAGANFVKTSTGFNGGGAALEDIKLMRKVVGSEMGVKASGGVKTMEDIIKLIESGANRIGTSSAVKILGGETTNKSVY